MTGGTQPQEKIGAGGSRSDSSRDKSPEVRMALLCLRNRQRASARCCAEGQGAGRAEEQVGVTSG